MHYDLKRAISCFPELGAAIADFALPAFVEAERMRGYRAMEVINKEEPASFDPPGRD
jgi:hypothetical protein